MEENCRTDVPVRQVANKQILPNKVHIAMVLPICKLSSNAVHVEVSTTLASSQTWTSRNWKHLKSDLDTYGTLSKTAAYRKPKSSLKKLLPKEGPIANTEVDFSTLWLRTLLLIAFSKAEDIFFDRIFADICQCFR